jgi:hypothetical protein
MKAHAALAAAALSAVAIAGARAPTRAAQNDAGAIVERASEYVSRFIGAFSNIVAFEEYEQSQTRTGSAFGAAVPRRLRLTSDVYFVRRSETENWVVFRDVLTRDGRPVEPRTERVLELLSSPGSTSREIADRVAAESARHALPDWPTLNSPMLALLLLQDQYRERFRWSLRDGEAATEPVVTFEERRRPTLFQTRDVVLVAFGEFRVERATGRVVETLFRLSPTGTNLNVLSTIRTMFGVDGRLGMDVPLEMTEFHVNRAGMQSRGVASYANFRRFAVTTTQQP